MKWLSRLLPRRKRDSSIAPELRETLAHWHTLVPPDLARTHAETRYVVVNTHASGLDADHDELLSVAAITVENCHIVPTQSFHAVLDENVESALARLLTFVGTGPVVVFNAELNRSLLERAFKRHLGLTPEWLWLDLYWILPAMFGEVHVKPVRLAQWMESLDISTFQRFHALGDAWVLAKLLLTLQSRARADSRPSPHSLADLEASLRMVAMR